MRQAVDPVDQDRLDQILFAAEVVLHCGFVRHAGGDADVTKGDSIKSVEGVEAFSGEHQLLLRRRSDGVSPLF